MSSTTVQNIFEETDREFGETEMDVIRLTREGVPKSMLIRLSEFSSFSVKAIARLLPISLRTIQRYEMDQKFDPDVSEHIILIARVFIRAHEVFDNPEKSRQWFITPQQALGQQSPFELLDTSFGAQMVINELGRLERGIVS